MKQQYALPLKRNFLISIILIIENCFILFAMPWVIHSTSTILWILLADIICIRATNLQWHITHEAVHGMLMKPRWLNECFGNALGALFFTSFSVARFGHLNHHRNNRIADTQEVYYDRNRPNTLNYYFEILGGFFLLYEFLLVFLAWAPKRFIRNTISNLATKYEGKPQHTMYVELQRIANSDRTIRLVRRESILLVAVLAGSIYSYAALLPIWLGYFFIRAFFVSYLNNMPHYRNSIQTDINASDNAYLPKWLAYCYLNFNYHRQHHTYPKAPWTELPKLFTAMNDRFDCHYFAVYLQQLKGPVYYQELRSTNDKNMET